MRKTTIYISGPMTGLPDFNRKAFHDAAKVIESHGFAVIHPASAVIENGTWEQYMRSDIAMLLKCDAVLMLPGWENSEGARAESDLAARLKMPIFEYPSLVDVHLVPSDRPIGYMGETNLLDWQRMAAPESIEV